MSDIVERLRVLASGRAIYSNGHIAENYYPMQAMGEAADEIDRLRGATKTTTVDALLANGRLREERDRLREALLAIVGLGPRSGLEDARAIAARAALAKETGQSPADKWEEEIQ